MDHYVGYPTCNDASITVGLRLIGEVLALDAEWRSSNGAPRLDVRTISGAQPGLSGQRDLDYYVRHVGRLSY
jgi:hypothetical protein